MNATETVNRRTLAKVLAGAFLVAGLLAGAAGAAEAKGLDDLVPEAPEVEHGIEIEFEHGVEIEDEFENEVENEHDPEIEDEIENEVENEVAG